MATIEIAPPTMLATIGIRNGSKLIILLTTSMRHLLHKRARRATARPATVFGGADRDRTGGLLVANQALSQLSYSPTIKWWAWVELNYRPHPYQGCALAN